MLTPDLADALGAQFTGEKRRVAGFDGHPYEAMVGEVQVSFGPRGACTFTSRFITHPAAQIPCLGHRDFFRRWYVCFDSHHELLRVGEHWG